MLHNQNHNENDRLEISKAIMVFESRLKDAVDFFSEIEKKEGAFPDVAYIINGAKEAKKLLMASAWLSKQRSPSFRRSAVRFIISAAEENFVPDDIDLERMKKSFRPGDLDKYNAKFGA